MGKKGVECCSAIQDVLLAFQFDSLLHLSLAGDLHIYFIVLFHLQLIVFKEVPKLTNGIASSVPHTTLPFVANLEHSGRAGRNANEVAPPLDITTLHN